MIYLLCAIQRPCKVWQFQRWEKNRVKNCLSPTKPNTCCTKNSWSSGIMSNFFGGQLFYVLGRVVQKPTFLSNSKIDGRHKIFSLSMSKALEKSIFLENWCMFSFGLFALKFQQITFLRNVDLRLFKPP